MAMTSLNTLHVLIYPCHTVFIVTYPYRLNTLHVLIYHAEVKNGYEVVTSPVSDKYLPGILIGYARDIKTDSSNITQSAHLTPAADFSGLDMVLVITEVKDSGDLEDILN